MADNDVPAVDVSTITVAQPDIGEAGIEMPSQKRKRRVPKPFTPSARVNAAKNLVEKATRQKKTKKTVRPIQPRVSPGKTPSPVNRRPRAGPSDANLGGYVIPKKRQVTPLSSDDSDSDTPPPPKRSQKTRAFHHEDLVELLSSFKEGILNEVDGRFKQCQQQSDEHKEDRRWLKGIEHREFKAEAIKQQVKHNDAIFRLVAEARDNVECGGEKGRRNAEACLEAAESKINKRQKFLVAGHEFGFQVAESSFGEGAQDFSGAELQQIMQHQSMMAKIQTFKGTGYGYGNKLRGQGHGGDRRGRGGSRSGQGQVPPNTDCFNCGEPGHFARDCSKERKDRKEKKE